jgi:hypothetical protein
MRDFSGVMIEAGYRCTPVIGGIAAIFGPTVAFPALWGIGRIVMGVLILVASLGLTILFFILSVRRAVDAACPVEVGVSSSDSATASRLTGLGSDRPLLP